MKFKYIDGTIIETNDPAYIKILKEDNRYKVVDENVIEMGENIVDNKDNYGINELNKDLKLAQEKILKLEKELEEERKVPKSAKELKGRVEELTKDLELANNRIKELEEEIEKYKPTSSLELDDETEENGDENGQIQE